MCDCEGTGYEGPTCDVGLVTISSIPTLTRNVQSPTLQLAASPDEALTVRMDGGENLQVTPSEITITYPEKNAEFTIMGMQLGHYTLRYALSGSNADTFSHPEDSSIFVSSGQSGSSRQYFQVLGSTIGILSESCCVPDTAVYSGCPMSTEQVKLHSTCAWETNGQSRTTSGIVFSRYSDLSLPLSIIGINVTLSRDSLVTELPQSPTSRACTPCDTNRDNIVHPTIPFRPEFRNCYYYNFNTNDVEDFLTTRSLGTTYLSRIRPLLPAWLTLTQIRDRGTNFNIDDYVSSLVAPDDISGVAGCNDIIASEPGLYSVFRYGRPVLAFVSRQPLLYNPSRSAAPLCFAVNLCKGMTSPVFVQLTSAAVQNRIKSLSFLRPYNARGWEYTIRSAAIFKTPKSVPVTKMYWNGLELYEPSLPPLDLTMKADVAVGLTSGTLSVGFDFSGIVHYLFNRMQVRRPGHGAFLYSTCIIIFALCLQERNAILDGQTELAITVDIGGSPTNLVLTSAGHSILFTSGTFDRCCLLELVNCETI